LAPLAFLGFLGYQVLGLRTDLDRIDRTLAKRQAELTRMQGAGTEMVRIGQEEAVLDQRLSVYPPRMVTRAPIREILGKISRTIPMNITLTALSLTADQKKDDSGPPAKPKNPGEVSGGAGGPVSLKGEILPWQGGLQLQGTVFGEGEEVLRSLDRFSRDLAAQEGFKEIRLEEVKRSQTFKSSASDFTLSGKLQF
jgi:Tfp pilus assembly protein PilN